MQKISVPKAHFVGTWQFGSPVASVGSMRLKSIPYVWAITMRDTTIDDSNPWDFCELALFERVKGNWIRLQSSVDYSQLGSFMFTKQGVLVWDSTVDGCHWCPSRYRCRLFEPKNHKLICTWERTTKGVYKTNIGLPRSRHDDPLLELGYRMRWWSKPITIKKNPA